MIVLRLVVCVRLFVCLCVGVDRVECRAVCVSGFTRQRNCKPATTSCVTTSAMPWTPRLQRVHVQRS